jgi:hypothetical protein
LIDWGFWVSTLPSSGIIAETMLDDLKLAGTFSKSEGENSRPSAGSGSSGAYPAVVSGEALTSEDK